MKELSFYPKKTYEIPTTIQKFFRGVGSLAQ